MRFTDVSFAVYAAPAWASDAEVGITGMPGNAQPANVTLQRNALIGGNCCLANVGRDVLTQAQSVSIDFDAISLTLEKSK